MLEGYLYLHLDLGSGAAKLRSSNQKLDDGAWHRVEILRNQKVGTINVDEEIATFQTPGKKIVSYRARLHHSKKTARSFHHSFKEISLAAKIFLKTYCKNLRNAELIEKL